MKDHLTTKQTIDAVAKRVGLVHDQGMQDWEIQMVTARDAERLVEFYDSFENPEEKSVLMRLIIAAYDDYLGDCYSLNQIPNPSLGNTLIKFLNQDWALHWRAVKYWSCFDHGDNSEDPADESESFPVTPMMRKIWRQHSEPK